MATHVYFIPGFRNSCHPRETHEDEGNPSINPGGSGVLKYEDAPRPLTAPEEILVKYACGVNPVEWKIREGYVEPVFLQ